VKQRFQEDMARLQQGQWFQSAEFYSPLFNSGNILDYLNDSALVILDVPGEIKAAVERIDAESQELRKVKLEHGELPQGFPLPYLAWEELEPKIKLKQLLALESWNAAESYGQTLPFTSPQSYGGILERFPKTAKQIIRQGQRLLIVSHQAGRLAELLQEEAIHASPTLQIEQAPPPGSITLLQGSLPRGWEMRNVLNLVTDAELFGFVKQARSSKRMPVRRQWLLPQLRPGDYVVHIDHGIGRFSGLTKIASNGIEQEYFVWSMPAATGLRAYRADRAPQPLYRSW
jgi:Transcription-repair coupling factor (superfamily II helicase)